MIPRPRLTAWRWWGSGVLLALQIAGCRRSDASPADTATPVVAATTARASIGPFTRMTAALGTVVARPGRYAALSAPSATRITRVYVSPGQRVAAGQSLVTFEQAQYAAAARAAESALDAAQRGYDRAVRLAGAGILPGKDVEAAASELARARNDALAARRAMRRSVLRSPLNGVVTRMDAVLGAPADAGQVLVEVVDPSAFDVVLSAGASEASAVLPGSRVALTAGEKTGGEVLGTGRVASVGVAVDSGSRAVQIRVTIRIPARALRLGESVHGMIAVSTTPRAVVAPTDALVPGDEPGSYHVFVVDRTGTAHVRAVTIGSRTENAVEILSGLTGEETIVTGGAFAVQDGARIARPRSVKP